MNILYYIWGLSAIMSAVIVAEYFVKKKEKKFAGPEIALLITFGISSIILIIVLSFR